MLYDEEITKKIIGAAQEVHRELGFGFMETVYGNALYKELKFRMLSRYRKIKVDSRLSAAEDRGRYSVCSVSAVKLLSSISFYLLLSPSISFYLQGKRSLRKLSKELSRRGMKCECQKPINVYYKGEVVGHYIPDMIVDDKVIVELKAVADLRPEHEWQLVNYLVACHKEIGLLINFGHSVKVKRKIQTENKRYIGKEQ